MRNIVKDYVDKFTHERQAKIRLARIVIILGLVVAMAVFWELRYTGIALTNETNCGLEEHTHTEECYEEVPVCGQEESEAHVHSDACYETQYVLVCGQEESEGTPAVEGHTHTEDCCETFTETRLICGQEESAGTPEIEGHTHTDACYETVAETLPVCGREESESIPAVEGHTHTDACYEEQTVPVCGLEEGDRDGGHIHTEDCCEKRLICDKEEHTHTIACMSDDTADVETASVWESTLPDHLTGIWADDLVLVAQSQLGYTESTENYIVNDSGDKKGYTRYGAWYGDPYGNWCAMFVSFCLHYSGIGTDLMPRNSGCYAWTVNLSDRGMYASASGYTPKAGDIVFFDRTGNGRSNHVGIVEEVTYRTADGRTLSGEEAGNVYMDEDGRTVIDVGTEAAEVYATGIKAIEGNASNMVKEKSYDAGSGNILGYGILPQQPGAAAEKDTTAEDADIDAEGDAPEEQSDTDMLSLPAATAAAGDAFGLLLGGTSAAAYDSGGIRPMQHGTTSEIHIDGISVSGTYPNVTFIIEFDVNTSVTGDTVYIELGEGIAPSENLINQTIIGYDLNGNQAFTFTFVKDDDGNWDIRIVFEEGYLNDVEDCWIRFKTELSGDGREDETGENYEFEIGGETVVVPIPGSTTPGETESVLDVTKTGTEFDRDTNSFTYTVIVSSDTGTNGGISLDDKITVTGGVSFEISGVTIQKVGENGGVLSEGQYTLSTDSDGNIHISGLPDLGEGEYYIVRYIVTVDADYDTQSNVKNTITGTTKDEGNIEVTDDGSTDKWINPVTVIQKSGVLGEDGRIRWTITINPNGVDINGFILSDLLDGADFDFSSGDCMITDGSGNTTNSGYEITGDGTIVFTPTEYEEVDGEQVGRNHNKYVIEYVTDAPAEFGSWSVTNEADLDKGDDHETGSAVVGDTNGGIGKIVKSDDIERDEANGIIIIPWETTLVIASGGIPDGAVLADELEDDIYNHDYWTESNQWYTYDQICTLINTYFVNGITFSGGNGNTVTIDPGWFAIEVYDESLSAGWGDETSGWITYDPNTMSRDTHYTAWRITFQDGVNAAYADPFAVSDEWTLVMDYATTGDISAILSGEKETEEYANYTFIQSGEKKLDDTAEHTEHDSGGNVRKLGDDMQDGSSNITVDEDGNMSWTVEVYVGPDTSGAFTVTDNLPAGVTPESIVVGDTKGSMGKITLDSSDNWTATYDMTWVGGQQGLPELGIAAVTADVRGGTAGSGRTVVVEIPENLVAFIAGWYNTDGNYITITFNVKIDEDIMEQYENGEIALRTFINSVEVTHNGSIYGTDSHEQNVEFEPAEHSILSKSYEYNSNDPGIDQDGKKLSYQVVINPDAKTFLGEGETLTFTDTASILTGSHFYEAYLTLDQTSVRFSYLYELTPAGTVDPDTGFGTYTYADANGNTVYFEYGYSTQNDVAACESTTGVITLYVKEAADDISWTYDNAGSHGTGEWDIYNDYTITAEIPDGVAMMAEYTYTVHMDNSINGYENAPIHVTNSATLAGAGSTSSSTNDDDQYGYDEAAGGVLDYIIIHKVDSTNYGIELAGAAFTLYYWSDEEQDWVYLDDFVTNEEGMISITASVLRELYPNYQNVGFKLIETSAPVGYILTDEEFCFYISGDESAHTPCWPDGFTDYAVELDNVYHWSIYADNVKIPTTEIEIEKLWKDEDGRTVSSGLPESITLNLYRYALKGSAVDEESGSVGPGSGDPTEAELVEIVTIVPDAGGSWYHKTEDLPQYYIEDGFYRIYYYYFEESSVNGWTPDYGDIGYGSGVTEGTVTVTNTCSAEYELPEAGGMGTGRFTLTGLAMIIAAGAGALLCRGKRRGKGRAGRSMKSDKLPREGRIPFAKTHRRSWISLLTAAVLCLGAAMPITADASSAGGGGESYTLTITESSYGEQYTAYKIFDLTYSQNDSSAAAYTIDTNTASGDAWYHYLISAGINTHPFTFDEINSSGVCRVTWNENYGMSGEDANKYLASFFKVAAKAIKTGSLSVDKSVINPYGIGSDDPYTATAMSIRTTYPDAVSSTLYAARLIFSEPGYYLIVSTLGSAVLVDSTNGASITIAEKNDIPALEKEETVWDENIQDWVTKDSVNVGDILEFEVFIEHVDGQTRLELHDHMSAGLFLEYDDQVSVDDVDIHTVRVCYGDAPDDTIYGDGSIYNKADIDWTLMHPGNEYEIVINAWDEETRDYDAFELIFDEDFLQSDALNENTVFRVVYYAEVTGSGFNEEYQDIENNYAFVSYGRFGRTDFVYTYAESYGFDLQKADGEWLIGGQQFEDGYENHLLAGAEFELYHADEEYDDLNDPTHDSPTYAAGDRIEFVYTGDLIVDTEGNEHPSDGYRVADEEDAGEDITTTIVIEDGEVSIYGIAAGNYILRETKAPEGYILPDDDILIRIVEEDFWVDGSTVTAIERIYVNGVEITDEEHSKVAIANDAGDILPETGGTGTTVFTVTGLAIIAGAGGLMYIKRRKRVRA